MKKSVYLFIRALTIIHVLILPLLTPSSASEPKDSTFSLIEVRPNVLVHYGQHVPLDHPEHDDIANLGVVIGDNCVAIIDTGGSIKIGQIFYDQVRLITDKPICYVINTHIHYDHLLGNLAFKVENPAFIGHQALTDAVLQNRSYFLENFRNDLGESPNDQSIIGPTITVENELEIDLGNRVLKLIAFEPAHTHSDLVIHDLNTGTVFTGDLVFSSRIPVLDGNLKGWISAMAMLKDLDAKLVIPGHGTAAENWDDAIRDQERYLNILLKQTREMIEQGLFMEEIIDQVGQKEKLTWLLYEQDHKRNVTKAFSELEWE